ncbi:MULTISPECIES: hypothetical protein [unclassified Enterococcus]|uniref:hypothetical protein n=1 Tax=unclassified Enterococcus TaxID=2608891 RepID=UPI003D273CFA
MKYGFIAVVGSLLFVAAGCGTSSEAEEKTEEVSILTAVLVEDPIITWRLSSGEVYADITLKDMVKLQGEFNPRTLRIPALNIEKIEGDFPKLTEGTKIRLVTELSPPTTRSEPPQLLSFDPRFKDNVREFTILD